MPPYRVLDRNLVNTAPPPWCLVAKKSKSWGKKRGRLVALESGRSLGRYTRFTSSPSTRNILSICSCGTLSENKRNLFFT
jgi:hypothetical protein